MEEYYSELTLLKYKLTEYQKELIKSGLYEPSDFEEINEVIKTEEDKSLKLIKR